MVYLTFELWGLQSSVILYILASAFEWCLNRKIRLWCSREWPAGSLRHKYAASPVPHTRNCTNSYQLSARKLTTRSEDVLPHAILERKQLPSQQLYSKRSAQTSLISLLENVGIMLCRIPRQHLTGANENEPVGRTSHTSCASFKFNQCFETCNLKTEEAEWAVYP